MENLRYNDLSISTHCMGVIMTSYEHKARQLLLRMDCFKFSAFTKEFLDAMSMSASDVCELANVLQELDTLKQGGSNGLPTPTPKSASLQNALWEASKIIDSLSADLLPHMDVAKTQEVIHQIMAWKESIYHG